MDNYARVCVPVHVRVRVCERQRLFFHSFMSGNRRIGSLAVATKKWIGAKGGGEGKKKNADAQTAKLNLVGRFSASVDFVNPAGPLDGQGSC